MEIIIGRNSANAQLKLTSGKTSKLYGQPHSVPLTVSRNHCKLTSLGEGKFRIENLNVENETRINGNPIVSKVIKRGDTIEIGPDRHTVSWDCILSFVEENTPKTMDIRPLRIAWYNYEKAEVKDTIKERRFNTLRSATGIITMLAIISSFFLPRTTIYLTLYLSAFLISVVLTLIAYRSAAAVPKRKKQRKEAFREAYKCKCCGHHYSMAYDELSIYNECPFCKAKFIK